MAGTPPEDGAPWQMAKEAIWGPCPESDPGRCYPIPAGSGVPEHKEPPGAPVVLTEAGAESLQFNSRPLLSGVFLASKLTPAHPAFLWIRGASLWQKGYSNPETLRPWASSRCLFLALCMDTSEKAARTEQREGRNGGGEELVV